MSEIEKKVLHEMTRSVDNVKQAADALVTEEYFLYPHTKNLFKIIQHHLKVYGTVLQSDTLESWMRQSIKMSQEDKAKVAVLFEEVKLLPDMSDFRVLIDEFRAYYKINSLKKSLDSAVSFIHDKDPDKASDQLKSDLVTLDRSLNFRGRDGGYFGNNAEERINTYLDAKANPEKYKGIESGFPSIDRITGGFPKGTMTIIIGVSKGGKSTLMMNMAYHNLLRGKRVYYHVNEGGRVLVDERLVCRATGLEMNKILWRTLSDSEFDKYAQAYRQYISSKQLYVDSVARGLSTASYIERKVDDLKVDGPVDLIIVDYMSLMRCEDTSKKQGYERLDAISMDLKDLAMKLNIPIITIMHVSSNGSKAGKDRKYYTIDDMGLSREPAKNVDLVLSWWTDIDQLKKTNRTDGFLSIQVSRYCTLGDAALRVDTSLMKIEEVDLSKYVTNTTRSTP